MADQDEGEELDSEEDCRDLQLWRLFPQLKELPESLLNTLAKEKKTSERLGVNTRLAHNAKKMVRHPVEVEKGVDSRREKLHPARFLGGVSCSHPEQWAAARRVIGESGVPAIGNYDLDSVGCGGCVSPKAWLEIHNPASQELRIKLFQLSERGKHGIVREED